MNRLITYIGKTVVSKNLLSGIARYSFCNFL